jgi:hypothetical protein
MKLRVCIAGACVLLSACASTSTTPNWDRQFGDSVRATLASQIIDPGAARNASTVSGIDGRAAKGAQDRYELSVEPPPAPTGTLAGSHK